MVIAAVAVRAGLRNRHRSSSKLRLRSSANPIGLRRSRLPSRTVKVAVGTVAGSNSNSSPRRSRRNKAAAGTEASNSPRSRRSRVVDGTAASKSSPPQQTYQGRSWTDADRRDGGNWRDRRGGQQQQQPPQQTRQGGSWVEARGQDSSNWRDRRDDRRDGNRTGHWDPRNQSQGYYQGGYYHGESGGDRRWDNRWRHDNRYDWHNYRRSHPTYFRVGTYYAPYRNYSYRRVTVGFFLDSLFFGDRYWINDPWQYRLPDVYGPYRWVRYYDDAVLVDIYSGEVVDVINNFFW